MALTLMAFAANPLLCRMALGESAIDASSFTVIRLLSGALVLTVLARSIGGRRRTRVRGDWRAASALFLYMIAFSFAYRSLTAGTGALLLFGAVQVTMIVAALRAGERLSAQGWVGLGVAFGGLIWLAAPSVEAPPVTGAVLMTLAGVGWGVYSLRGRGITSPLEATAANFLWATPMALLVALAMPFELEPTPRGIGLAVASGALASALGYALWYRILPTLAASTAATLQLLAPPLTAAGGALLLEEAIGLRLVVASAAILGGIALVIRQPKG